MMLMTTAIIMTITTYLYINLRSLESIDSKLKINIKTDNKYITVLQLKIRHTNIMVTVYPLVWELSLKYLTKSPSIPLHSLVSIACGLIIIQNNAIQCNATQLNTISTI